MFLDYIIARYKNMNLIQGKICIVTDLVGGWVDTNILKACFTALTQIVPDRSGEVDYQWLHKVSSKDFVEMGFVSPGNTRINNCCVQEQYTVVL